MGVWFLIGVFGGIVLGVRRSMLGESFVLCKCEHYEVCWSCLFYFDLICSLDLLYLWSSYFDC